MATTVWYVRVAGLDANSGGSDSDAGRVTRESGTTGTVVNAAKTLTDLGATFQTSGVLVTDAVNINVAGTRTVFEIASIDSETQITLVTAPANGSYDYTIGGARAAIKKAAHTAAGHNPTLATTDLIYVQTGTYTENAIAPENTSGAIIASGGVVTVDGTGGGAGSDCFGTGITYVGITATNALDCGFVDNAGNTKAHRCMATSCGGRGFAIIIGTLNLCSARACTGIGINVAATSGRVQFCEAGDGGTHGF